MRRALIVVVVAAAAVFLCLGGRPTRTGIDYGLLGWAGLGLLILGGLYGAAYARAQRGWADYQDTRRLVPFLRRVFVGKAAAVIGWALVIAATVGLYLIGRK